MGNLVDLLRGPYIHYVSKLVKFGSSELLLSHLHNSIVISSSSTL